MIEALLVVLSNPVGPAGARDADFNDWYTNIHTRDALRFRGSIAQQRFHLSARQAHPSAQGYPSRYLALYEVFDAQRFSLEHIDNMNTSRMVVEDSFDATQVNDFYYYPLAFRDNHPRQPAVGGVVLEQINILAGSDEAFRNWYSDTYLPGMVSADGVLSGALLAYETYGQMLSYAPSHSYVGVYRLSCDAARDAWTNCALKAQPLVAPETLAVTCWDVLTSRITHDDVLHTSSEALAAEEQARTRIARQGTRVVNDGSMLRDIS